LDAVARHNLGKSAMDKETLEKVSRVFMRSIPILFPNELLYALIYCFNRTFLRMLATMIRIPLFVVIHPPPQFPSRALFLLF